MVGSILLETRCLGSEHTVDLTPLAIRINTTIEPVNGAVRTRSIGGLIYSKFESKFPGRAAHSRVAPHGPQRSTVALASGLAMVVEVNLLILLD